MMASRRGFSLMEVMLSTSILVGSSIVLIELATIGRKQATSAYDLNRAQLLCQSLMDEIVAEIVPLKTAEEQEFENEPDWLYSIEYEPLRSNDLIALKVTVTQKDDDKNKPRSFSLVRWLPESALSSSQDSSAMGASDRSSSTSRRTEQREEAP